MFCATTLSRKPSLRRQGSDPDVTCAGLPDSQVQRKSQESRPLAHVLCSPLPLAAPRFLSKQTFGGGDCRDRTQLSRNPATRPKHRPRPGQAPPWLSPTPPGLRNRGPGRAGSPERLGPESTVAGTHPKGCHHGQAAPAEPGPPLPPCLTSGLDSEVKCPDLGGHREPSRYPEETRSPQIPRPLSWDGYAPPDPAQRLEEGLVAGVAGLCVSPPSPSVTDTGRLSRLSTLEPSGSPTRYLKGPEVLHGRYHSGRNWTGTIAPRRQNPGQGSGRDP